MSRLHNKPLMGDSAIEVFRHHMHAKIAKAASIRKGSATLPPHSTPCASSVPSTPSKKRAVEENSANLADDKIIISFDPSKSIYSSYAALEDEVHRMLLPSDDSKYEELGCDATGQLGVQRAIQAMSILIHLTKKAGEQEGELKKLGEDTKKLRAQLKEQATAKAEADQLSHSLKEQLAKRVSDSEKLQSALFEVRSLKSKIAIQENAVEMAAAAAEIKMKAKIAREWENNMTEAWDIKKIYAEEKELEEL